MVKSRCIGDGHPTFNRNPYNGYINPYYWVDDHPLLYGNNGSLDPSTYDMFPRRLTFHPALKIMGDNLYGKNCFHLQTDHLVGGWTNPSEKYARQNGNLPQTGVKIKKYLKPPSSHSNFTGLLLSHPRGPSLYAWWGRNGNPWGPYECPKPNLHLEVSSSYPWRSHGTGIFTIIYLYIYHLETLWKCR